VWWQLASILSGGILGLFLLGMISRVKSPAAVTGVLIGTLVFAWATFSPAYPFHTFLIIVIGAMTILLVGILAGRLFGKTNA